MCYAYLRLFAASAIACGLFVPVAQAAPVANLPLTCPDPGAIGQPNQLWWLVYQHPHRTDHRAEGAFLSGHLGEGEQSYELRHRGCLYDPGGTRYLFEL